MNFFKIMIVALVFITISSFKKHPNHIGIVNVKYTSTSLQITTKLNITDLETTLRKSTSTKIDILNPSNKPLVDSVLFSYINTHLQIAVNSKFKSLTFVGYERVDENIETYLELKNKQLPKKININCNLLYDYFHHQTNLIHIEIKEKEQSKKLSNPAAKTEFNF